MQLPCPICQSLVRHCEMLSQSTTHTHMSLVFQQYDFYLHILGTDGRKSAKLLSNHNATLAWHEKGWFCEKHPKLHNRSKDVNIFVYSEIVYRGHSLWKVYTIWIFGKSAAALREVIWIPKPFYVAQQQLGWSFIWIKEWSVFVRFLFE